MKQIKKLSTKLLLVLGVIILSVIVWQVIVSKRVIGDMQKLKETQPTEQIIDLLKNKELKTYNLVSSAPFSKIKITGVNAHILKGNEYAVYVSDYIKRYVQVKLDEDELSLNLLNGMPNDKSIPVFIIMPQDPQLIHCNQTTYNKIRGFEGKNTQLLCEGWQWPDGEGNRIVIATDMPYLNVNQKECHLDIYTTADLDSTLQIGYRQVNANVENGMFYFFDEFSDSMDVNIQLQNSTLEELKIHSGAKVGTLNLQGTLFTKLKDYDYRDRDEMRINYPGQCDSLIIQLTGNPEKIVRLLLSKDLSGRFENLDCSNNVLIERDK